VGDVLGQLGDRCADHVPLAARDPGQAAAPRQQGGRDQQRCRAGLGITFTAVLPRFAPATGVGKPAVHAYAARAGQSVEDYLQPMGPLVTPELAGTALLELVQSDAADVAPAYLLTGTGLQQLP